jgi:peptide/nickel transport system permease protein
VSAISQRRGWWTRLLDSDLAFNFFSSPSAMVAAVTTALLILAAATAAWISPHHPMDLASLDLLNAELPPAWVSGGTWRFVLGTDNQGRDVLSAILYGLRTSLFVGFTSIAFAMLVGVSLG